MYTEYSIPNKSLKDILLHLEKVAYLLECRYHDALIAEMHEAAKKIVCTLFYADACKLIRQIKNRERIVYSRYHDTLTEEILETAITLLDYLYTVVY